MDRLRNTGGHHDPRVLSLWRTGRDTLTAIGTLVQSPAQEEGEQQIVITTSILSYLFVFLDSFIQSNFPDTDSLLKVVISAVFTYSEKKKKKKIESRFACLVLHSVGGSGPF
jgi:hypothetical protein